MQENHVIGKATILVPLKLKLKLTVNHLFLLCNLIGDFGQEGLWLVQDSNVLCLGYDYIDVNEFGFPDVLLVELIQLGE